MAKKVRFVRARRYASRARSGARRARGFGGGSFLGPIIDGALAGLAASTLNGRVPYGSTLGIAGVGWFRKNNTLLTLAGMQAAQLIPNPLAGAGASTGGGFI